MMEFILDKNVDIEVSQSEYPAYFFNALRQGRIKLVIGGTEYRREVKSKTKLLELFSQLITAGKTRAVDDKLVDEHQALLTTRIQSCLGSCPSECDDPHIFALAHVSKCMNILTKETRMATCRDKIRTIVGHDYCPNIRIVRNQTSFDATLDS